jgi:hypothetical protein
MTEDFDTRFDPEGPSNDFRPKFKSREEACGFFFAGVCRGASPQLIAHVTGMNVGTIRKLLSKTIRKYVGIKKEFQERGEREFGETYYTVEIIERLKKAHAPPARRPRARRAGVVDHA